MSQNTSPDPAPGRPRTRWAQETVRKRRVRRAVTAGVTLVVLGVVSVTVVDASSWHGSSPSSAQSAHGMNSLPEGLKLTGDTGPMGGQEIALPGTATGTATAGTVTVDGVRRALGHIPLMYAVHPTWTLRNTGTTPVTLGTPKLAVVKGCCPADVELGATTLAPGAWTTVATWMQMHPGMDGYHDFQIQVPVSGSAQPLLLDVTGDFSSRTIRHASENEGTR